jgi:hypothetical protein
MNPVQLARLVNLELPYSVSHQVHVHFPSCIHFVRLFGLFGSGREQ